MRPSQPSTLFARPPSPTPLHELVKQRSTTRRRKEVWSTVAYVGVLLVWLGTVFAVQDESSWWVLAVPIGLTVWLIAVEGD
jgi:fatty acid desaturase